MEWQILAMHWYFGANKTLWSVKMILDDLEKWHIIFTNIKFNTNYINPKFINNLYFFEWIEVLHDILAFSWYFATKVSEYNEIAIENNTELYPRYARPKIKIYFDEMWIFWNSSDYQDFHKKFGQDLTQYILQIRKLFVDIQFLIQKPNKLVKELRQYVNFWIKPEPLFPKAQTFFWLWFLKNMKKYYLEIRDEDGELEWEKKIMLNTTTWIYENYEVPLRSHFMYLFRVPYYYKFYDDLYLNLKIKFTLKTDFLIKSNFLKNVYLWVINNAYLKNNKKIYDEIALASYPSDELTTLIVKSNKKPRFRDNPSYYYVHFLYWLKSTRFYKIVFSFYSILLFWFLLILFFIYKL